MKKLFLISIALVITGVLYAQAPQAFKYQAVLRDSNDDLIVSQAVTLQITIENSTTDVYVETHSVTTSQFGLVTLNIGEGTVVSGVFATIDWGADTYSVKVEVDAGSGYEDMGTSQLLSVPYALFAGSIAGGGSSNWTVAGNDIYNSNSGNVGIGLTSPLTKLDVSNGFFGLRTGSTAYDAPTYAGYGGLVINAYSTVGSPNKISFVATGNSSGNYSSEMTFLTRLSGGVPTERMTIKNNGKVAIGISTPVTTFHVKQHPQTAFDTPGDAGISLENSSSTALWTIYNSNSYLSFAFNNVRVAYVSESTGAWTTTSDARLKTGITSMESVLDRVMLLNPVRYSFKKRENSNTIGFIAQDVEPLFPEVVSKDNDSEDSYYGIAYGNMSIIAIKAIQEQQLIIESQQHQIDELQRQIDELRQLIIEK